MAVRTSFAARNRYPERDSAGGLAARLSRRPGRAWLVYVALSVPYLAVNLLRSAAPGVHVAGPLVERLARHYKTVHSLGRGDATAAVATLAARDQTDDVLVY